MLIPIAQFAYENEYAPCRDTLYRSTDGGYVLKEVGGNEPERFTRLSEAQARQHVFDGLHDMIALGPMKLEPEPDIIAA